MQYLICQEKRKILQILPKTCFFFIQKNAIWKKHHMQGKIKPDDANTEKQSLDLLFSVFP
jgi:hypothetical protein